MTDLISVIIPVYNKENYLKKCIDSLINQTYSNIEIILVNDGSSDKSPEVCDEYSVKDSRIRVINSDNKGVSAARNLGIDKANGRYLMFVDADDWVAPDFCEEAIKIISENDSDIGVFGFFCVDGKSGATKSEKRYKTEQLNNIEALERLLKNDIENYIWNKIFKASVFFDVRFVENIVWEDLEIMHRLFLNCQSVVLGEKCTYFYQNNDTSITNNITAKTLENIFTIRYTRHKQLCTRGYKDIAERGMNDLLLSALNLYDFSLKQNINTQILADAKKILNENKNLALKKGLRFKLFFNINFLYRLIIRTRQLIGSMLFKNRR